MNFGEFLKEEQLQKKCKSMRALFEVYSEGEDLDIKFRTFQAVASSVQPPNAKLLTVIFKKTPAHRHKLLVQSYFQSVFEKEKIENNNPLKNYLDIYLNPNLNTDDQSVYTVHSDYIYYSKEQLEYLAKHANATRMFKSILLRECVPMNDPIVNIEEANRLISLHLLKSEDGFLKPLRSRFRVPTRENSPPPVASAATQYLLSKLDLYISKEGADEQKICHTTQLVKKSDIPLIFSQLQSFLNWLQNMTTSEPKPGYVPMFYFACTKMLRKGEI